MIESATHPASAHFVDLESPRQIGHLGQHQVVKKGLSAGMTAFLIFLTFVALGSLISLTVYEFKQDPKENGRTLSLITYGTGFGMGIWLALAIRILFYVSKKIFHPTQE